MQPRKAPILRLERIEYFPILNPSIYFRYPLS